MAGASDRAEVVGELRLRAFEAGHELNNVLTALVGTVEVLGLDLGPERAPEIQRLLSLTDRARGVADALLLLGDAGTPPVEGQVLRHAPIRAEATGGSASA